MRFASLDSIGRDAAATLRRFPLTLGFAWLACGVSDAQVILGGDHPWLMAVVFVATLGIALSLGIAIFAERLGPETPAVTRGALYALAPVALALVAARWNHWPDDVAWRRYIQISLLGHALVAVLPYARVREPNGFWQYNRVLLERFVVATLFAAVLFGGLTGALATLKPLFGITVSPKAFALLGSWVWLVFHPWFFLAGVPADLSALEARREYPATLRVFAQFILVPLVAVYQLLLTAYLVKVVVTQQWPSGLIGWLVSVEATAGMLALLLVHPVRELAGNLWVRTFSRGFYFALLPSIAMLAVSIAKRVGQYGITEDRYFVMVLTGWLAAISVTFIARRDADIRVIPLTLAMLALMTLGGPWGPYRISLASQRAHLIRVLEANGLWKNGWIGPTDHTMPFAASKELSSTIAYMIRAHGSGSLRPLFGDRVTAADSGFVEPRHSPVDQRARQLMTSLGLNYVNSWEGQQSDGAFSFSASPSTPEAVRVDGYEYHVRIDGLGREFLAAGRHLTLDVDERNRRLILTEHPIGATNAPHPAPDTLAAMALDGAITRARPDSLAHTAGQPLGAELSGDRARGFARFTYLAGRERPVFTLYGLTGDLYFDLREASRDSTASGVTIGGPARH